MPCLLFLFLSFLNEIIWLCQSHMNRDHAEDTRLIVQHSTSILVIFNTINIILYMSISYKKQFRSLIISQNTAVNLFRGQQIQFCGFEISWSQGVNKLIYAFVRKSEFDKLGDTLATEEREGRQLQTLSFTVYDMLYMHDFLFPLRFLCLGQN